MSGHYFDVLGVRPAAGRLIGSQDEPSVGESAVAVLSYDYWQREFGGDPTIVNKTVPINGRDLTIVGVAPEWFQGAMLGWNPQVFVPLTCVGSCSPRSSVAVKRTAFRIGFTSSRGSSRVFRLSRRRAR